MGLFSREPIIADRAEFVEALRQLQRGHVLVRVGDGACSCVLDGALLYHSFRTLKAYGLIDRFDNPEGFRGVEYYRLSSQGRAFADRAWKSWRAKPVLERLIVRLTG